MPQNLFDTPFETIAVSRHGSHVAVITLNRPHRRNAFNTRMAEELIAVWDMLADQDGTGIRAAVLTGAGDKAFCAGADLKERDGMTEADWRAQHKLFEKMSYDLMALPIPVIAAVEGAAFAGGFELVLACSFAYAASTARFALTEVTLGLIPGIGGTQNLPRRVGLARAQEILLTGSPFGAAEAFDWGILNRLCTPGETVAEAIATAERIAGNAPLSVRRALAAARDGSQRPLSEGLKIELENYETLIDTEDRAEGIRAFNEKRNPVFHGH